MYQATFKRYEIKYLLSREDKEFMLNVMRPYMALDRYGRTTIRNIYMDTENYRLIRRSLEKPAYKEKLRVRSYSLAGEDDPVFVELKKKYKSVVYKRRLTVPHRDALRCFALDLPLPVHSQIGDEIEYFREYYKPLKPMVFLSYEREAFYSRDGSDFRITLDENILYRQNDLLLSSPAYGRPILGEGETLMEVKTSGGLPMWMSHALNERRLFKTSFSKYGMAYMDIIEPTGGKKYA